MIYVIWTSYFNLSTIIIALHTIIPSYAEARVGRKKLMKCPSQNIMDNISEKQCSGLEIGRGSNMNYEDIEKEIPSCCLKAKVSVPKLEGKCHSTVLSGWFSQSQSSSGHHQPFYFFFFF